jgi:integral membrane sensor domain MASE1
VNVSFGIPLAATFEGLLGSYLVNKYAHGLKAFETVEDVFRFVSIACICAPAIGATLGIAVVGFSGRANLGFIWGTWWLAHSTGILLLAPFLTLLFSATFYPSTPRELTELTILLAGLMCLCLLVFGPLSASLNTNQVVQAWLCVPFLTWAAFRFRPLEAAGTTLILFGSAIWGTLHGYGSFVAKNLATSLFLLDGFIGVIGTMTLVLAIMVVEQRRIRGELLDAHKLLQEAAEKMEKELIVTVHALEVELARHDQSKKALGEIKERFRRLGESTNPEEKRQ